VLALDSAKVTVNGEGVLRLDFGREHAAWFEFESPDLGDQARFVQVIKAHQTDIYSPRKDMPPD
jgi:hypothetical protein